MTNYKTTFYALLLCIITASATAQIQITQSILPDKGDEIRWYTVQNPGAYPVSAAGGNQVWDFSGMSFKDTTSTTYKDPSEGAHFDLFPTASLLVSGPAFEYYYIKNATGLFLLGTKLSLAIIPVPALGSYTKPYIQVPAPLKYNDTYTQKVNSYQAIAFSDLPDTLINILNLPVKPDSIRLNVEYDVSIKADAWGAIKIKNKNTDVLRYFRKEIQKNKIEAKIGILPYFDITSFLPIPFKTDDTIQSYIFLNNDFKEFVAQQTIDNVSGSTTDIQVQSTFYVGTSDPGYAVRVNAYPNPASSYLYIDIPEKLTGQVDLRITDVRGMVLSAEKISLNGATTARIATDKLADGSYILSVSAPGGKQYYSKFTKISQ